MQGQPAIGQNVGADVVICRGKTFVEAHQRDFARAVDVDYVPRFVDAQRECGQNSIVAADQHGRLLSQAKLP
jgi:hypothetical protein